MAEVSIIRKSELEDALRIDAEYYRSRYLDIEKKLNFIKTQTIGEISESVVNFGAYSLCNYIQWEESGVPYLNVQDIKDGYIDFSNTKFINEKVDEILKKSKVKEGQVILTMAGTIGNVAVAHKIPKKVNSNQATAKITLKKGYSPYFLAAFLNSCYGKSQTEREIVSSVQPNIFLFQIKNFKVPIVSDNKQKEIENIYKQGLDELENSKSLYSQAEQMLLEELGIRDLDLSHQLFYTTSLKDTKQSQRIDAEYYQPKYERVIEHIKKRCKVRELGTIITFLNHGKQPPYIENGNIPIITQKNMEAIHLDIDSLKDIDTPYTDEEFIKKYPKYKLQKNDVLFYSVGAYLGRTNVFLDNIDAVSASFITIIRPKEEICNPIYLSVLLNSLIGQLQSDKYSSASAQQYIYPKDIAKFLIPILETNKQQKLADLILQSHQARKQAKELLEEAKEKVEKMILGEDDKEIVTPVAPRVRIPKIKFAEYPMLDGSKKVLVQQVADGSIIKRFDKTPIPQSPTDVVCPHFLELKWAYGCPYDCSWCYLKGTFRFSPIKASPKIKDFAKIEEHTKAFLESVEEPEILNTGEIADSLMYEGNTKSFSSFIIPIFESQDRHKVLFLTKSNRIQNPLRADSHKQIIVSFSLNADTVAKEWELKAPLPCERLKAAEKLYEKGYEIRLRIDPIVPIEDWERYYLELLNQIFDSLIPERITLGSLRGLQSTINGSSDRSWVKFLTERSNWGRKIEFNIRHNAYKRLIDYLGEKYAYKKIALCKETKAMWKVLNMDYRQIRCNCIW